MFPPDFQLYNYTQLVRLGDYHIDIDDYHCLIREPKAFSQSQRRFRKSYLPTMHRAER